jgi:hypothetical protein
MTSLSRMPIVASGPERDRYVPLVYVADHSSSGERGVAHG